MIRKTTEIRYAHNIMGIQYEGVGNGVGNTLIAYFFPSIWGYLLLYWFTLKDSFSVLLGVQEVRYSPKMVRNVIK